MHISQKKKVEISPLINYYIVSSDQNPCWAIHCFEYFTLLGQNNDKNVHYHAEKV